MDTLDVEVLLSRPAYRLGGTVVGTVRVVVVDPHNSTPKSLLHSLDLFLVGSCRLDPRWHNVSSYKSLYEGKGPRLVRVMPKEANTIRFWATEPINLLLLREREHGRWEDVKPKPIHLPGMTRPSRVAATDTEDKKALEESQLAFSFRTDLPLVLPHTMSGTSCRYHYAVVVRWQKADKSKPQWIQMPFTVLTADPELHSVEDAGQGQGPHSDTGSLRIDACHAMAHSSGLPCGLTANELHQLEGGISVNRHGASLFRHIRRLDPSHLQSMRVADPNGVPVCVLTMVGVTPVHPGSQIILKFDFANSDEWVPTYQVSACLQGDESVIRRDGSRQRARSYIFDTAHERIDPQCVERTCLHLTLPLETPSSIETEFVQVSTKCIVDIAVGNMKGDGFQNLRLELPCQVTHSVAGYERSEDDEQHRPSIAELLRLENADYRSDDPADPSSFETNDIRDDLKILSFVMTGKCGLRPQPRRLQLHNS